MRQSLHFVLSMLAFVPWACGNIFYLLAAAFVLTAHKAKPHSKYGNCWTYALPRWLLHGGYLAIRPADGVRLLRLLIIPHALWVRQTPGDGKLKHFAPDKRRESRFLPWYVLYFRGHVKTEDAPHDAEESRL